MLWVSWFDREGVITSDFIDLSEQLPLVLVLLLVLQRFGRRQWGEIPELGSEKHSVLLHSVTEGGALRKEEVGVDFYPEDGVYSGWSLLGRATTVIGASTGRKGNSGLAEERHVGAQSGVGGDTAETMVDGDSEDDYRRARDDIIKAHNLVLKIYWPETWRNREWEIVTHARTLGKTDKFIRGHVPEVKYARDFDQYSTRYIRDFLDLQDDKQAGTRTLRLVVMDRLRPIHDLRGEQLWDAFWECFACRCFFVQFYDHPLTRICQVTTDSGSMGSIMGISASTV